MNARPRLPQLLLVLAAGAAAFVLASRYAGDGESDTAEALVPMVVASPARATGVAAVPPPPVAAPRPTREAIAVDGADAFGGMTLAPPPAPAPTAPPPPPAPSAPPLPFRYVGLLEQGAAQPTAFIARGEVLHIVKAGDVIDGTYRIESLAPAQVVLTYLPLQERQTLGADGGRP
jgi:hypothetical protein